MMAEGGGDLFRPLLRWYLAMLPMAKRRTELWFNRTDAAGQKLAGVRGAWFVETETQFGTFVPSEKGCVAQRMRELERRIETLEDFRLRFYQSYTAKDQRAWSLDTDDESSDER